jgi:ribonuclease BN (tRNA processing enzyme)
MEIKFIGTGSAFCHKNFQSNMVIENQGKNFLVDCGTDIRRSLMKNELTEADINAVFISHLHSDHIGGLEWLAFTTFFNPTLTRPKLYIEQSLIQDLWRAIGPGLESIQGQVATLDTYFELMPVEVNKKFEFAGVEYDAVQAVHVSSGYKVVDSYGLMFNDVDEGTLGNLPEGSCGSPPARYYITTDCQFAPETSMMAYYREATVVFHDCETTPFKSGVHPNFDDIISLPEDVKEKMFLYHYQDNVVDEWKEWNDKAKSNGLGGFIKEGAIFSSTYGMQCND